MNGAYFYNSTGSSPTLPASAFTLSAANLFDGFVGDSATGYAIGTNNFVNVLIDLGSVQTISAYELAGSTPGWTITYSTNGTSWTVMDSRSPVPSGSKVTSGSAVSCRYIQADFNGPPGLLMTDFRVYDGTGAIVVGTVNQQVPIGPTTSVAATGTDAPTSLNYPAYINNHSGWEIANPSGTIIAYEARYTADGPVNSAGGWTTQATFVRACGNNTITSFPITPPAGTPITAGYEIRSANPNSQNASAYFDVVAAGTAVASPPAPRRRPAIVF